MKRKLALLLALVMVISMLPMTAFAASDNTMTRVVTVGRNANLQTDVTTPILVIDETNNTFGSQEIFRLQLGSGAKWNSSMNNATITGGTTRVITNQILEVTGNGSARIEVPMNVTLDGAEGEQRVTIDRMDSAITGGTYTYAVAASGATVATVGSKTTVNRGTGETGATILLDETRVGSVSGTQQFRLRLPRGFVWENGTTITTSGFGAGTALSVTNIDGRDATVTGTVYASSGVRGSITITPQFEVTRSADHGDVKVDLTSQRGNVSSVSGLVVASYKDYGITVEIDDVEEFYAGRVDADYITDTIVIEENVAGSFLAGRTVDFELPSWVRVAEDFTIKVSGGALDQNISADLSGDADVNTFSFTVPSTGGVEKLELEIPLTISGTRTGDITLTVKGAGIEETEVVVAKAVAPVTVEVTEMTTFAVGVQNQLGAEILITEVEAGAIMEKEWLNVTVQDAFKGSMRFESFKYEVIEGDLDVNDSKRTSDRDGMQVYVNAESSEASTIRIYDIKMTLDRTIPEGPFSLNIGGPALVNNGAYDGMPGRVDRFEYMTVGTPAPAAREEVKFTIGSTNYIVGTELEPMGVAPYIQNNRTFVPVTFVARALGMDRSAVVWDGANRTVTIFGDRVVQMEIGSNVMTVNGTAVTMDAAPEITGDRTFVPIAHAARALGVDYSWDQATQTVTFY